MSSPVPQNAAVNTASQQQERVVLYQGPVFTSNIKPPKESNLWAECLVSKGETIAFVGSLAEAKLKFSHVDEVVDASNGLILPGFHDAHCHPILGGLDLLQCDLSVCNGLAEALQRIDKYAEDHPELEWVIGGSWVPSWFPNAAASAAELDKLPHLAGRPAAFYCSDRHSVWVNSKAMELAGVLDSTEETLPDTMNSKIERDDSRPGRPPIGCFREGAMNIFKSFTSQSVEVRLRALEVAQREMMRNGIVAYQDAMVRNTNVQAYLRSRKDLHRFPLKASLSLMWDFTKVATTLTNLPSARSAGNVAGQRKTFSTPPATATTNSLQAPAPRKSSLIPSPAAASAAMFLDGRGTPVCSSPMSAASNSFFPIMSPPASYHRTNPTPVDEQVADMVKTRSLFVGQPRIRANTIKMMTDGAMESRTAFMSEPYCTSAPTTSSSPALPATATTTTTTTITTTTTTTTSGSPGKPPLPPAREEKKDGKEKEKDGAAHGLANVCNILHMPTPQKPTVTIPSSASSVPVSVQGCCCSSSPSVFSSFAPVPASLKHSLSTTSLPPSFSPLQSPSSSGQNPAAYRGVCFYEKQTLLEAMAKLAAEGFQLHAHTCGDQSLSDLLDGFERTALVSGVAGQASFRHHIAHLECANPKDIPRIAKAQVCSTFTPFWLKTDDDNEKVMLPVLGPIRAQWQYPIVSVMDAGARVCFGSDWPVTTLNPMEGLEVALTHRDCGDSGVGPDGKEKICWRPTQKVSLETAVLTYTICAAYVNFLDAESGSLEVGKKADICVLDRNIFKIAPTEIHKTTVRMTVVNGECVYPYAHDMVHS